MSTVIFDVDGTLVDTNYHHAIAWHRAFRQHQLTVPLWVIHRHIGMGGDKLVGAVAGDQAEQEHGDDLRAAWSAEFDQLIPEVTALPGAVEALQAVREAGHTVVLATSGKPEHVRQFLDLVDGEEHSAATADSGDAEQSKPAPDLLQIAVERVSAHPGAEPVVLVGDSVWDCRAGTAAGVPVVGVRSGGFGVDELREAGAVTVLESLTELSVEDLPFATLHPPQSG